MDKANLDNTELNVIEVSSTDLCSVVGCGALRSKTNYSHKLCDKHHLEKAREYRKNNPDKFEYYAIKKNYGITKEEYEDLAVAQGYVCAICFNPETAKNNASGEPKKLAVDHCRTTGNIRGLLCSACNVGLGLFKEDAEYLASAIAYITKTTEKPVHINPKSRFQKKDKKQYGEEFRRAKGLSQNVRRAKRKEASLKDFGDLIN